MGPVLVVFGAIVLLAVVIILAAARLLGKNQE